MTGLEAKIALIDSPLTKVMRQQVPDIVDLWQRILPENPTRNPCAGEDPYSIEYGRELPNTGIIESEKAGENPAMVEGEQGLDGNETAAHEAADADTEMTADMAQLRLSDTHR